MMHHRSQTFVFQLRNLGKSSAAIAAALIDPQGPLYDTEGLHWPAEVVAHALYAPEGAHLPLHTVTHAPDEQEGLGLPF